SLVPRATCAASAERSDVGRAPTASTCSVGVSGFSRFFACAACAMRSPMSAPPYLSKTGPTGLISGMCGPAAGAFSLRIPVLPSSDQLGMTSSLFDVERVGLMDLAEEMLGQ